MRCRVWSVFSAHSDPPHYPESIPTSEFTESARPVRIARTGRCMQMRSAILTFKSITARPVVLKLKRPVVARIAIITDWPLILIDLYTEEGVVGRSYLEPY